MRRTAARLLETWDSVFNRTQVRPRPEQIRRIRVLLDAPGHLIPPKIVEALRFTLKAQRPHGAG